MEPLPLAQITSGPLPGNPEQKTSPDPPAKRSLAKILSVGLVGVTFLLLKMKGLLFLVFAKSKWLMVNPLEGFSLAQLAMTGGSMVVTIAAYAMNMGFRFALGFVLLTVIHELGHALVIRAKGLRASAMVFIPFVGGAVTLKDQPTTVFDDAQIGLAGPIAGTLASFASLFIFEWTGQRLYLAIAFAGFILNLFNLLPIGPLDGGRISTAISRWMWLFGGLILVYVMITWRSPLLILVLLLGLFQMYKSIREPNPKFYSITAGQRGIIAIVYFGLLFCLGYQSVATHKVLEAMRLGL